MSEEQILELFCECCGKNVTRTELNVKCDKCIGVTKQPCGCKE
jgi:Zn finger protein HypA/HybF involved in hydrogenase expression